MGKTFCFSERLNTYVANYTFKTLSMELNRRFECKTKVDLYTF